MRESLKVTGIGSQAWRSQGYSERGGEIEEQKCENTKKQQMQICQNIIIVLEKLDSFQPKEIANSFETKPLWGLWLLEVDTEYL